MNRKSPMRIRARVLAAVLVVASVFVVPAALAAGLSDVKPGLWETTRTTETTGMPPMDFSNVPPERRAKLEEAFKARQAEGPRTSTTRHCITPEDLKRDPYEKADKSPDCKRTRFSQSGSKMTGKVVCEGERATTGEFTVEVLSPVAMRQDMKMAITRGANTTTVKSSATSKWLGADCGEKAKP
jgi:hypothetical protein